MSGDGEGDLALNADAEVFVGAGEVEAETRFGRRQIEDLTCLREVAAATVLILVEEYEVGLDDTLAGIVLGRRHHDLDEWG